MSVRHQSHQGVKLIDRQSINNACGSGVMLSVAQVGSLEKMALKIVDREDFGKVVQQWVQLHSIMRDDDRDSEREAEEGTSSGSPGSSKLMSGPGSPKSPLQGVPLLLHK